MSDKGFEGSDKMSVEFVSSARGMSDFILQSTYRGPGDTVDAAMHRAERMYGAPASWMHRLRYRSIKDMPVSAYAAIARAYKAALEASEKAYAAERELAHARNSKLLGIADALAGTPFASSVAEIAPVLVKADAAAEGRKDLPDTNREG
ncbi:hypothetical protein CN884_22635 [Ochrobactrum sp. 30A/1000/2015]|jgi:hypothetical protein|uniref:Uncharacterized protein n=1 Tax=Brucella oryzae TaxID=335286 RepID=A0A2S7IUI9_9HYPH|nr:MULTISPECIES: hypothetical protein [Brucella]PJT18890.1 hypothetical protein CN884_22635 [Ochrobactrum sp. 30A/1000/2015]PJT37407.1 hypothetical protein CN883_18125 [Ochrobactrum sp. 27A/999/2015]PJT41333.1 hypothetical protein CN882_21945 [Ochrobactrum sp. 23A/997/2015]KAB2708310.1 hypothetical protein F9K80_14535 [Brucella intermedia]NYD82091.1 hypothetical protein [Brucella intermedia]